MFVNHLFLGHIFVENIIILQNHEDAVSHLKRHKRKFFKAIGSYNNLELRSNGKMCPCLDFV